MKNVYGPRRFFKDFCLTEKNNLNFSLTLSYKTSKIKFSKFLIIQSLIPNIMIWIGKIDDALAVSTILRAFTSLLSDIFVTFQISFSILFVNKYIATERIQKSENR